MTGPSLTGRHAVVTGASQGIGAAIVMALAERGASVTLLARNADALLAMAARLPPGTRCTTVVADVTDAAAVTAAINEARQTLGPIHVLINNAGQAVTASFARMSLDLWNQMLAVNLTGTFVCTQAVLPDMLAAGWGRIVNVASSAGLQGYAYASAYSAAKHGVVGLTRSLAIEVAGKGITVNAVCPGYTETDILHRAVTTLMERTGRSEADLRAQFAVSNREGRILQPQEVADMVVRLCGEEAAGITGQAVTAWNAVLETHP